MEIIVLFLSLFFTLERTEAKRCDRITEPMCIGVGYKLARFPNGLGHSSNDQARLQFHRFLPLLHSKCSESFKEFICSVYFPECLDGGKGPLKLPSRKLCQDSYSGCSQLMRKFGYAWPKSMDCNKFPGFPEKPSAIFPSVRKPLDIPSTFILPYPYHKLNIQFSPRSITFPSCCSVYYYTSKVIDISSESELSVKTADVRTTSGPEVTIERIKDATNYFDGKYITLLMVNHYMNTISDKQLYVSWMVANIVNEDVTTGITIKEYEGPRPSIATSDTYHFLLYQHSEPIDVFAAGKYTTPAHSRYRLDLDTLFKNKDVHLTAATKMKVDIDEYVRFREVNEFAYSEQEVCNDVKEYPHNCNGKMTTYYVNR